jgi:hypothetical protein
MISFTRPVLVIPLAFSRSLTTPRIWSSTGMSLVIGGWITGVGEVIYNCVIYRDIFGIIRAILSV